MEIKILNIPYNYVIKKKEKNLIDFCIGYLINTFFYENIEISYKNYLVTFSCFTPLPTTFILNDEIILEEDNILVLTGSSNKNRTIFANKIIPYGLENPIPFTYPVNLNKRLELLNSCVFYYEIELCEQHRVSWMDETIVIGYGAIYTNTNTNPGWKNNTFGYHLDDGTYQYNSNVIKNFGPKCKINDIFGAGIIYLSLNNYRPFFTINGKIIDTKIPDIIINQKISPMIGFDHSHKVKFNFGKEEFKFTIKNYLHNNNILSNNNNYFKKKKNQKISYNDKTKECILNYPHNIFNNSLLSNNNLLSNNLFFNDDGTHPVNNQQLNNITIINTLNNNIEISNLLSLILNNNT